MQRIPNRLLFILVVCLCRGGVIIFSKIFSNLKTWKFSNFTCIVFVKNACFVPYKQEYTIEYTIEHVSLCQCGAVFHTFISLKFLKYYTFMYQSNRKFNIPPPPGHPLRAPLPGIWIFLGNLCSNSRFPGPESRSYASLDILPCKLCLNSEISLVIPSFFSFELPYPDLKMPFWYHFFFKIISSKHSMKSKYPQTFVRDRKDTIKCLVKFPSPREGKGIKCPGYARGWGCWSFDLTGTLVS